MSDAASVAAADAATAGAASSATAFVVGIGVSSRASALEIAATVSGCLGDRRAAQLAVPASRAHLGSVREAAALLGLALDTVAEDAIEAAQPRCLTRPCRAARAVAEGAALASAGPTAWLLGPRVKSAHVTCAVAARGACR